jgi:hypothetical protein
MVATLKCRRARYLSVVFTPTLVTVPSSFDIFRLDFVTAPTASTSRHRAPRQGDPDNPRHSREPNLRNWPPNHAHRSRRLSMGLVPSGSCLRYTHHQQYEGSRTPKYRPEKNRDHPPTLERNDHNRNANHGRVTECASWPSWPTIEHLDSLNDPNQRQPPLSGHQGATKPDRNAHPRVHTCRNHAASDRRTSQCAAGPLLMFQFSA